MNRTVNHILQRVLVNTFYRSNAGFFLFGFFILFGVVQPVIGYHLSLIQGMIENAIFLGCVILLWFLYTIKCINHTGKQLKEPGNTFLFVLNKLPHNRQFAYLLWVHMQIYFPVFIYAIVVAVIAARQQYYGAMMAVIVSNACLIGLSAYIYRVYLQKQALPSITIFEKIQYPFSKPLFSLPLWFLIKERKQMLLVTKLFTMGILYIFLSLYEPEQNDIRPLLLVLMLASLAHCSIVFQVRLFEEEYLAFSRNFPVHNLKRFGGLLLLYTIILVPELAFIWKAFPAAFQLNNYPQIVLFTIALPVFFHSILLMEDVDSDSYLRLVFITAAVLFFIVLYDPGIVLPVAYIALSFVFFNAHFNTFEKRHN